MASTMLLDPRLAKPVGAAEPVGFNSQLNPKTETDFNFGI